MTVAVDQTVVHAPCVDTDGTDILIFAERALADRILDLVEDPHNVPAKRARHDVRLVGKAVVFGKSQLFTVEVTHDSSAAGCAEVDCQHFQIRHFIIPPCLMCIFRILLWVACIGVGAAYFSSTTVTPASPSP